MPARFLIVVTIGAVLAACSWSHPAPTPAWAPPLLAPLSDTAATIASVRVQVPLLLDRAGVTGLSLAILANGEVAWSGGFGVADEAAKRPMTETTVVEAASLGKVVCATVALRLVESGQLDLDRPVANDVLDPDVGNDPLYGRVTLRQLLSHSAGLPNLRHGTPLKIYFPPGDHFSYSGTGFTVIQHLIEKVTGEPLDAVARRLVFDPAGMTRSSYVWQGRFDGQDAVGHDENGKPVPKRKPTRAVAPASLQTTAADYGRFLAALLGSRLVKTPTLSQMLMRQTAVVPTCVECLGVVGTARSPDVFWGLGIGLDRTADGDIAWHWGDNDAFKAYVAILPSRGAGVAYFANSQNGLALRDDLVRHILGGEHPDWTFVKYDQYDSPATAAKSAVQAAFIRDPTSGLVEYERQRAAGLVVADESYLDLLGFKLLDRHLPHSAVAVWELEAREFPNSWHAFDSLGLGYTIVGDRPRSTESYKKALTLNPGDANAKRALGRE
jgi:CubicO group peptidase (beta-lactamase class C family)